MEAGPRRPRVLLFVPNLIGYLRVLLALAAFQYAHASPTTAFCLYALSQLLDAADGFAARRLHQASTFGAVLDMVTDRVSTTCLAMLLAQLYQSRLLELCILVHLDFFSHWFHMVAAYKQGQESHKVCANSFLRLYYWKPVLFIACAGTELWYLLAFAGAKFPERRLDLAFRIVSPIMAFKQVANVAQLAEAVRVLVELDCTRKMG